MQDQIIDIKLYHMPIFGGIILSAIIYMIKQDNI